MKQGERKVVCSQLCSPIRNKDQKLLVIVIRGDLIENYQDTRHHALLEKLRGCLYRLGAPEQQLRVNIGSATRVNVIIIRSSDIL